MMPNGLPNGGYGDFDPRAEAMKFLMGKGLSREAAAGIVGNLGTESRYATDAVGDGGNAFGLAQWNGPRKAKLFAAAKAEGTTPDDFDFQLRHLWGELQGPERGALIQTASARSPDQGAVTFSKTFERPGIPHYEDRIAHARAAYQIGGGDPQAADMAAAPSDPSASLRDSGQEAAQFRNSLLGGQIQPGGYKTDAAQEAYNARENNMADLPSPNAQEAGPAPFLPGQNPGGLGGLGGALLGGIGPTLQAIGMSLMAAKDRRRPLEAMPSIMMALQAQAQKAREQEQEAEWRRLTFRTGRQDHADTMRLQSQRFDYEKNKDTRDYDFRSKEAEARDRRAAADDERLRYGAVGQRMAAEYPELKPGTPEFAAKARELAATERASTSGNYGLAPIWGVDEKTGEPVVVQLGKDGKPIKPEMPAGVKIGKDALKLDAGTHWVLLDPVTRQPTSTIPKNNMEAARETGIGTAAAGAAAKLGGALDNAQMGLDAIDKLMTHKGLEGNLGWQGKIFNAPGSEATDAATYMDQLNGQSFLGAYNDLRGAGAITVEEGKAATNARTRMAKAQNAQQYREALQEYRQVILNGMERAKQMAAGKVSAEPLPSGIRVPGRDPGPTATPQSKRPDLVDKYGLEK